MTPRQQIEFELIRAHLSKKAREAHAAMVGAQEALEALAGVSRQAGIDVDMSPMIAQMREDVARWGRMRVTLAAQTQRADARVSVVVVGD